LPLEIESPTPKRLVLDLLGCCPEGLVPVSALVTAGSCFGIAENSVRMALGRLVAGGLVSHEDRSLYRLAARASAVLGEIAEWRALGRQLRPWHGGWIAVLPGFRSARVPRGAISRAGERTLAFRGFQEFDAGLRLRPDNLDGGVDALRLTLYARGLDRLAIVCELRSLGSSQDQRARRLWNVPALTEGYRRSLGALEASTKRIPELRPQEALAETFLLAGHVERQLALDPRLPGELMGGGERDELEEALDRYEEFTGPIWQSFFERHGVPDALPPRGTGLLADAKEVPLPDRDTDAVGI
jgi:phenylacetic acid degradation operon negative regulatory protein